MNRREAEAHFMETQARELLEAGLAGLKDYQEKHGEAIEAGIENSLDKLSQWAGRLRFRPDFIIYTLLRTELLEHRGRYLIRVYDPDWYYGQWADFCWYDAGWGFRYFFEFWEQAQRASRRYMGKVSLPFVQNAAMRAVMDFHRQIAQSFQGPGARLFSSEQWKAEKKKTKLFLGEYMGSLIPVRGES